MISKSVKQIVARTFIGLLLLIYVAELVARSIH